VQVLAAAWKMKALFIRVAHHDPHFEN
jgi:hypothetical protein